MSNDRSLRKFQLETESVQGALREMVESFMGPLKMRMYVMLVAV